MSCLYHVYILSTSTSYTDRAQICCDIAHKKRVAYIFCLDVYGLCRIVLRNGVAAISRRSGTTIPFLRVSEATRCLRRKFFPCRVWFAAGTSFFFRWIGPGDFGAYLHRHGTIASGTGFGRALCGWLEWWLCVLYSGGVAVGGYSLGIAFLLAMCGTGRL